GTLGSASSSAIGDAFSNSSAFSNAFDDSSIFDSALDSSSSGFGDVLGSITLGSDGASS
ncbi:19682_t:CDS:1, partial [Cetraspora pellucida]